METDTRNILDGFGTSRYTNRETSWLAFAHRLTDLAGDGSLPVLERAKFFAIVHQGLDEFFQVRIAGLKDQLAANVRKLSPDGLSPRGQLKELNKHISALYERLDATWWRLAGDLAAEGVEIVGWKDLSYDEQEHLESVFLSDIYPILTPLAVDPSHPFPYLSNLSLNLAVRIASDGNDIRLARVKVPPLVPRFVQTNSDGRFRFVPLEQVMAAQVHHLFPEMEIGSTDFFRVTRNADIILEEGEADDLLALVETELRRRRFGRAVRLEVDAEIDPEVLDVLSRELRIHPDDVYRTSIPLGLDSLWSIYGIDRPELKSSGPPLAPPVDLVDATGGVVDIFSVLRVKDVLVHHPYESFSLSVEAFIEQAASDPDVLAIKQTLYRTSGDSTIIASLIKAAERGKQVAVLVEVKARFDEMANIGWAKQLEEAGVHVVYGLVGLKTHLKAILVVRKEGDHLARYCHLGTGNYNARTARSYEDFGLLSSNAELGSDLTEVFNMLTGFSKRKHYSRLVLAPMELRPEITRLIAEEVAKERGGRIVIKVNGLTDPGMVDELYAASIAGVSVDLLVRGICSIRPGIQGLSENIRVRSLVGSILEHSRIYLFGGPRVGETKVFLASADLMQRNLDRRVEALIPIEDNATKVRILEFVNLELADDTRSWKLGPEGGWERIDSVADINAQQRMSEIASERFDLHREQR